MKIEPEKFHFSFFAFHFFSFCKSTKKDVLNQDFSKIIEISKIV